MDYVEAREYLMSAMKFGSRLGLERMDLLMEKLGNPGEKMEYIHVAGTNGKGSVTTMIADSLAAGGHRVGVYISPFIERFAERIRVIDGKEGLRRFTEDETYGEIPDEALAGGLTRIRSCVDDMLSEGMEHPTEFELVTALAFLYFEKTGCSRVVLETGLGGRLDSTNWISSPRKCVLTAIGYDHMDRLGDTIQEITAEKAGIIKPGADVVMYDPRDYAAEQDAPVILSIVRDRCEAVEAKSLTLVGSDRVRMQSYTLEGQTFFYHDIPAGKPSGTSATAGTLFHTSLLGIYQPMNCAVAIETCRDLVAMEDIQTGIRLARWPARMEWIRKDDPPVFLDGGHNLQGAVALRDTLDQLLKGRRIVFLCGVMRDKEYKKMLETLLSSDQYRVQAVLCTRPENPRALPALFLAKTVSEVLDNSPQSSYNKLTTVIFDDKVSVMTDRALQLAAETKATLVAFGSLYMAGEIRRRIRHDLV